MINPWACGFGQEDFYKLHFGNLFSDPVTYLQQTGTISTNLRIIQKTTPMKFYKIGPSYLGEVL